MPKKNRGYWLEWRKDRNTWEIIWYERGQRRRRSASTTDRKSADKKLKAHIETAERRAVSRLIGDVLDAYQKEHAPHTASPESIAYAVLNLDPFFGQLSVEQITKGQCQKYVTERREQAEQKERKVSNDTLRKELTILQAALNHDKGEKRIPHVPKVWMPDPAPARDRWFTRKEAASLLSQARKGPWYLPWFIVISLYSGQRKQAVLSLTWDRVNLETGKINWEYGRTTNKRRPMQPMPYELWMFLRYLSAYGKPGGYVLHIDQAKIGDVRTGLRYALKEAKISRASAHTLKHTALTWMMQNGTGIWEAAGFSGTSAKTIEKTYAHHCPDHMEEARTHNRRARLLRLKAAPVTAPDHIANVGKMVLSA